MRLRPVEPAAVPDVWAAAEPYLAQATALTCGRLEPVDVRRFCEEGQMMLCIVWNVKEARIYGAIALEIAVYPRRKVLEIALCGGDEAGRWIHLIEAVEGIARDLGCQQMQVIGRAGWSRTLGWDEVARHYVKELE